MAQFEITKDVRKLTGRVDERSSVTVGELLTRLGVTTGPDESQIGLVLEWAGDKSKRMFGFDLKVHGGANFRDDREIHIAVKQFGGLAQPVDQTFDLTRSRNHIGAGLLSLKDSLEFEYSLDTDHPDLLRGIRVMEQAAEIKRTEGEGLSSATESVVGDRTSTGFPFRVDVVADGDGPPRTTLAHLLRVRLYRSAAEAQNVVHWVQIIHQIQDLVRFEGLAAIDCGNSSSSLAIKKAIPTSVDSIEIIQVDRNYRYVAEKQKQSTLKSAVYLWNLQPREELEELERRLYPQCEWESGMAALEKPDEQGLVVSPKRYLGKAFDQDIHLDQKSAGAHYPLELLLTSMLKEAHYSKGVTFHQMTDRQSGITLTYPSTFTRPEIHRLKAAWQLALVRALPPDQFDHGAGAFEPKLIDEASAAAFYFLYRDFFFSAGQVPAFRYIYPQGANVLVMDFGGGTTDIALVRCKATMPGDSTKHCTIQMKVLGRTGLRQFGGDTITCAVFRVLKTLIVRERQGELRGRREGESIEEWYKSEMETLDKSVPTAFNVVEFPWLKSIKDRPGQSLRQRRQLTKEFWQWAEDVKRWLGGHRDVEFPLPPGGSHLHRLLKAGGVGSLEWVKSDLPSELRNRVDDIREQLAPALKRLLATSNTLLRDLLAEESGGNVELHRAYILGQAAYYPDVLKAIGDNLEIQTVDHSSRENERMWDSDKDLDIRRLVFDRRELKNSVAKGAVLYNFVTSGAFEAEFEKDEDLADQLPFMILYPTAQTTRDIYQVGDNFKQMARDWKAMPKPEIKEKDGGRTITLHRRWPGDDPAQPPEPFYQFTLKDPIEGELKIKYVESRQYEGFVMRDFGSRDDREIRGEWLEPNETIPPMQRGDL